MDFAAPDLEIDSIDCVYRLASGGCEPYMDVVDAEQRSGRRKVGIDGEVGRDSQVLRSTFRRFCSPSPSRMNPSTNVARAEPGKMLIHHWPL